MPESEEEFEKFKEFWERTEIIREHLPSLLTFGNMRLPYIFAAEHQFKDRTVVRKGIILFEAPSIFLPSHYRGIELKGDFKNKIPSGAVYIFRKMGLPYSFITNQIEAKQEVEYGGLQEILDRFNEKLKRAEDIKTGLIKGALEGTEYSLIRYSVGLAIKSGPRNIKEFFDYMRRQKTEPIREDEEITDEEIRRLFEGS